MASMPTHQITGFPNPSQSPLSSYDPRIVNAFANAERVLSEGERDIRRLNVLSLQGHMLLPDSDDRIFPHGIQRDDLTSSVMKFTWGENQLLGLAFKVSLTFREQQQLGTLTIYQPYIDNESHPWHFHFDADWFEGDERGIYSAFVHQLYTNCPQVRDGIEDESNSGIVILENLLLNPTVVQIDRSNQSEMEVDESELFKENSDMDIS